MSDNYTQPEDDDLDDAEDFKNLRAKAKKADQVARENALLKRELAFTKAGIPLEDPRMSYFVKGYDGDLEPELIRKAAVDAGFISIPQAQEDPAVTQAREGQQKVMAAGTGVLPEFDPMSAVHGLEDAYNQGGLQGLSAYAQQYGVTLQAEEI